MERPGEAGPPPIESEDHDIKRELIELDLEAIPENIRAVKELRQTPNIPPGFEEIEESLNDRLRLKAAMEKSGINAITHAEGKNVWDHTRRCLSAADQMGIPQDIRAELRLILLYHDLGKTEAIRYPWNRGKTRERAEKGKLQLAMMGHTDARHDDIRAALAANKLTPERIDRAMVVIKNHMRTDLMVMHPGKAIQAIESFGNNDETRRATLDLLELVVKIDGQGTDYTTLVDGELKTHHDIKNEQFSADVIWTRYKEAVGEEARLKARAEQEGIILGSSLHDYLAQRGIEKGPAMRQAMARVREIIEKQAEEDPAALKKLIDETELS